MSDELVSFGGLWVSAQQADNFFDEIEAMMADRERWWNLDLLYADVLPRDPVDYIRFPDGSGYVDLPF